MIRVLLFFIILPFITQAQFNYVLDQSIPFEDQMGVTLRMPWVGGLNAAQYNAMDLDNDGKEDLVLYDRMADRVITFLQHNNEYVYASGYENHFPTEITNWLLLRDVNCDGKKDIFTGDLLGMKVYMNVSEGSSIQWKQFLFYNGPGSQKSEVLLTKGFSDKVNLQLQFDDLPAISDADGDGDLDIFNVRFVGNGTVEFHKNFSMERYGVCDSLDFERISQKWGDFTECECGDFAFNNENCETTGGRTKHAGGKSLLSLDFNGDGSQDLLLSEAECSFMSLLSNEGDLLNPVINSSAFFPTTHQVNFEHYPAAYFEDIDFDGKKDLIVTPNIFIKDEFTINLKESNWLYKNAGSNDHPDFVFSKTNFLQEQMFDVGDNAVPALFDYDSDGDYDLLVSQNDFPASIYLYDNVGTPTSPSFRYVDDNMLNLKASSLYNLKIQFADVNHDNRKDLAFTATNSQDNVTRLYYILKTGSGKFDFSTTVTPTDFIISSTENILLTHIDNDGAIDCLVGKSNGALQYWKNTTINTLTFVLQNNSYLNIGSSVVQQNLATAVGDLNGDAKPDLVITDQTGTLRIVSDFKNASDASTALEDIIFDPIEKNYVKQNLGGRVWPAIGNIFGTNKPAIIVGSISGGLRILKNDQSSLPQESSINVFPNPVSKQQLLNLVIDREGYVEIYSSIGKKIISATYLEANALQQIPVSSFAAGTYLLHFVIGNKAYTRRFIIY